MTNKIRYFAALFTVLFACAFLFPVQSDCRSYGGGSRSFGSSSRSSGSSFGSYKSKPSPSGSSFGSYKSKPSSPAIAGSANSFGKAKGSIGTQPPAGVVTQKPQSGRASLMNKQSQTRTQQNYLNKKQQQQQQSGSTYGSYNKGGGSYGSSKPYRAPTPRQRVVVKRYDYNGRPSYLWYDHGHYYDPWSYSSTWWSLHWAELEAQRDIVNDARYNAMRAQVEAMRAQGVVPDAGYTESVAPLPITEPLRPVSSHGFFFYLMWVMWVVLLLTLAGVITAFLNRRD